MIFIFKEKGTAKAVIMKFHNIQMAVFPLLCFVVRCGERKLAKTQCSRTATWRMHFPPFSVPYTKAGCVASLKFLLTAVRLAPSFFPESRPFCPQTTPYPFSSPISSFPPGLLAPWGPSTAGWPRGTYSHALQWRGRWSHTGSRWAHTAALRMGRACLWVLCPTCHPKLIRN